MFVVTTSSTIRYKNWHVGGMNACIEKRDKRYKGNDQTPNLKTNWQFYDKSKKKLQKLQSIT